MLVTHWSCKDVLTGKRCAFCPTRLSDLQVAKDKKVEEAHELSEAYKCVFNSAQPRQLLALSAMGGTQR
jgi:hypothetical protein